jgi:hypothetical protein
MTGMYEIALVNPRGGKRRRRKMPARDAKGHFIKRRSNPKKGKKRRRKHVAAAAPAPKRHKRKSSLRGRKHTKTRKTVHGYTRKSHVKSHKRWVNPMRKHRRRHRRHSNPRLSLRGFTSHIAPAAIGAAGALASDYVLGLVQSYLPSMLTTGLPRYATRAAMVFGVSFAIGKVAGQSKGQDVLAGGLAVIFYQMFRELLSQYAPAVNQQMFAGTDEVTIGYIDPASPVGAYMNGMGAYLGAPEAPLGGVVTGDALGAYLYT